MTKAIDRDFPFEQLNIVAELESWRKEINRPMYHIHKWWAQRLGSVFRTIVLSAISNDPDKVWERFYNGYDSTDRIILDPFMGSGTTLGEALKFGAKVIGCDINPISYFLVQKALEAVSLADLNAAYTRLETRVKNRIISYYHTIHERTGEAADILYTFWAMEAPCLSCGNKIPLFNNYIFSRNAYPGRKPEAKAFCPNCNEVITTTYNSEEIICPECDFSYNPKEGTAKRSKFYCSDCGEWHPIQKSIQSTELRPTYKMYANMLWLESGTKVYAKPEQRDIDLYRLASRDLRKSNLPIPEDHIPQGHNTNQARGYNFLFWKDLFNDRQLNSLSILLDGVRQEEDRNLRELLLTLFSSCLEFNSLFCSFKGEGTGAVRHMFYHHILKPERSVLENSVWGFNKSSGTFSSLYKSRLIKAKEYQRNPFELKAVLSDKGKYKGSKIFSNKPIETNLATNFEDLSNNEANTLLLCGDSSDLPIPGGVVDAVVTDPPYFDFVHYSELADYFYAWLKLALQDYHPAFQNHNSRHEAEVQNTNKEIFKENLSKVYAECHRVLKEDGLLIFTFHHSRIEGWESIYKALTAAGFSVIAAYPLKAEMSVATPKNQAKEPINFDSILVCRKRNGRSVDDWATLFTELSNKATEYVERSNNSGRDLSKGDIKVIVIGEALVSLSAYPGDDKTVENIEQALNSLVEKLHKSQVVKIIKPEKTDNQKPLF